MEPTLARPRRRRRPSNEQLALALADLRIDVHELREQIRELFMRRALLLQPRTLGRAGDPHALAIRKIATLFRAFNHGYHTRDTATQEYSEALMGGAPDLFEFWRDHRAVFGSRHCELRRIHVVFAHEPTDEDDAEEKQNGCSSAMDTTVCIVRVEAISHGEFTLPSLQVAFPRVLEDPDVTHELLGRPMAKPMLFHFEFNTDGCVVQYTAEPDFFAALSTALRDPFRAARLLQTDDVQQVEHRDDEQQQQPEARRGDDDEEGAEAVVVEPIDPRHSVAFILS